MKNLLLNFKKGCGKFLIGVSLVSLIVLPLQVTADTVSDSVITGKVKAGLVANKMTHATDISVATNNGVVSLSGTVGTDIEATTAVEVAQSTDGVKDVDTSNLTVTSSNQPLTDSYITAKVKGMFIRNNMMGNGETIPWHKIKVETKQGVVYLKGKVERASQVDKAEQLARSVDGVTNVVSDLKVS